MWVRLFSQDDAQEPGSRSSPQTALVALRSVCWTAHLSKDMLLFACRCSLKCAVRRGAAVLRHRNHRTLWGSSHQQSPGWRSLRVSLSSAVTLPVVSGLSGDSMLLVLMERKARPSKRVEPARRRVCAARAITAEVNELHHVACQRELEPS